MYIWKDKEGKKLTAREFLARFKEGILGITPQQSNKTQIFGTRLILLGLFLGLFISIYAWRNLWWVAIILIGALINTGVQYLGLRQQNKLFKNIEDQLASNDFENEVIGNNELNAQGFIKK